MGARRGKGGSLKFVQGYRMVEDHVEPSHDPLNLSRHNMLPGQEQLMQQVRQQKEHEERRVKEEQSASAATVPTWGVQTMRWTGRKTPGWLKFDKKVCKGLAHACAHFLFRLVIC